MWQTWEQLVSKRVQFRERNIRNYPSPSGLKSRNFRSICIFKQTELLSRMIRICCPWSRGPIFLSAIVCRRFLYFSVTILNTLAAMLFSSGERVQEWVRKGKWPYKSFTSFFKDAPMQCKAILQILQRGYYTVARRYKISRRMILALQQKLIISSYQLDHILWINKAARWLVLRILILTGIPFPNKLLKNEQCIFYFSSLFHSISFLHLFDVMCAARVD